MEDEPLTTDKPQDHRHGDGYDYASGNRQKEEAKEFIKRLEADHIFDDPIVTTLEPLDKFYEAEDYHKNFYERNRGVPYCTIIIDPKLKKLKEKFASLLQTN